MSDEQEPCGYPVLDCILGVYVTKCEDRIEALEARVAAADKLAEALRNTQLYLGQHAIPNALAAYQATKENTNG